MSFAFSNLADLLLLLKVWANFQWADIGCTQASSVRWTQLLWTRAAYHFYPGDQLLILSLDVVCNIPCHNGVLLSRNLHPQWVFTVHVLKIVIIWFTFSMPDCYTTADVCEPPLSNWRFLCQYLKTKMNKNKSNNYLVVQTIWMLCPVFALHDTMWQDCFTFSHCSHQ